MAVRQSLDRNRKIVLGTAQTGNGTTTHTLDRRNYRGPGLLEIISVVGATPTVTVNIVGSQDGLTFYNVAYALVATPETVAVAALTITTATTTRAILRPDHAWRFLRVDYSANTNVTLDTQVYS